MDTNQELGDKPLAAEAVGLCCGCWQDDNGDWFVESMFITRKNGRVVAKWYTANRSWMLKTPKYVSSRPVGLADYVKAVCYLRPCQISNNETTIPFEWKCGKWESTVKGGEAIYYEGTVVASRNYPTEGFKLKDNLHILVYHAAREFVTPMIPRPGREISIQQERDKDITNLLAWGKEMENE